MAKQTQPTPEELLGHHVGYEINQMVASLRMLGNLKVPEDWSPRADWQKLLNNALMESFYLHARALFEFFEKPRGARQYADASYEPFKGVDVSGWTRKLNNQVAHLLDGRTADDDLKIDDQDRIDMINALGKEVDIFKRALKPEYKSISIPSIPKVALQTTP